jgi:protoporphyrinogen/coproporphyrinogen III oxidase
MSAPSECYDVAIVGGGAAGLAAAWHLRDKRVVLLEQADRVGGRMRSESRGRYWINLGCHLFPGPGSVLYGMMDDLSLRTLTIPGVRSALAVDGRVYDTRHVESYPLRLPLRPQERAALAVAGLKLRRAVRGYLAVAAPRPQDQDQERRARVNAYLSGQSTQDLLGALPPRVHELLATAGRRSAADLPEQSAGVGASLFASVWGGKNAFAILNVDGGSGQLPAAVGAQLGDRVTLNAAVSQVKQTAANKVEVSYRDASGDQRIAARQVIVAVPAPHARRIVTGLPADLDQCLSAVRYGPFVSMGILTTETTAMPWAGIYAMTTPGLSFDMFFNHGNVVPRLPGGTGGSLMVYAGASAARRLLDLDDDQIRERFRRDLVGLYPQLERLMGETIVRRWELGNTYRQPGFDVTPLLTYSKRRDVAVHFAGDYFAELGNVEQAATAGLEAARRARQALVTGQEGTA